MPKRKSQTTTIDGERSPKTPKTTAKWLDKLGLTYKQFEDGAPIIHTTIALNTKDGKELVNFGCKKLKMSSGSYGWSGANKRINVEVEVDGKIQTIQAQVTLNITVLGSKKVEGEANTPNESDD